MELKDIKVGVFVRCIKPTKTEKLMHWNTFIFEIIEKLPNNKWKLKTMICARGAIKNNLKFRNVEIVVSQQTLQSNFKLNKLQKERKNEA